MAHDNDTKEWILIIIGLLIMVPIMVMAVGTIAVDVLKVFIENIGETVRTVIIIALILGGIFIIGQIVGSFTGSKSKNITREVPGIIYMTGIQLD